MFFDDPVEKRNKKIRKVGRNGAYALGGGAGLWFMNALYPYEESAAHIASMFGYIAAVLLAYGVVALGTVMLKRDIAIPVNILMVWLVLPTAIFMIFSRFWNG